MNWTLLHKYLAGECTPEEKKQVEDWIEASSDNRKKIQRLVKIWNVKPAREVGVDAEKAWESFKDNLSEKDPAGNIHSIRDNVPNRKGYNRSLAVSVAAAAVVFVAVLLYFFVPDFDLADNEIAQKGTRIQEVSTALGQRTSFRLSDGTRVYLNAASHLELSANFGDSIRSVKLRGEAFFEVAHDPDLPFIVYSAHSATKVLGTKFGVKAYPRDEQVQVAVEEGRVALNTAGAEASGELHLTASQVGVLGRDGEKNMSNVPDIASYVAWKDGRLVFRSTPFEKVIPQLERWYNIKVEAEVSLLDQQVTASFDDEPLLEVLNILALSLDAEFQREGRTISFNQNSQ
ncbi:FecR family protein [Fodinibius sediminis]|uniref:FecR family protein n=1 Tax=Fodinibius sediminis TaxID=1214077 RepID=A0A521CTT1_9BACT|nr:FecR domain-containing protein [Fodinibius sediminis]SMO62798.1 FecR family protein [Fodinibius sediminis]